MSYKLCLLCQKDSWCLQNGIFLQNEGPWKNHFWAFSIVSEPSGVQLIFGEDVFFGENLGSTKCYCFSGPGGLDWALPFCIKVNSWCPTILSRKAGVRPLGANSNGDIHETFGCFLSKLVFRNMSFETCLSKHVFRNVLSHFEACLSKLVFRNMSFAMFFPIPSKDVSTFERKHFAWWILDIKFRIWFS